jgi:hypothetical protein
MLAVDGNGRVLVVEVKHGGDTAGVGWTPAQVARYLRLCQLRVDATPWAASILNGMLVQARRIGLIRQAADVVVAEPVMLVPVIAVGQPLKNLKVANERMRLVHDALAEHGVSLPELEVWSVDRDGKPARVRLGELPPG